MVPTSSIEGTVEGPPLLRCALPESVKDLGTGTQHCACVSASSRWWIPAVSEARGLKQSTRDIALSCPLTAVLSHGLFDTAYSMAVPASVATRCHSFVVAIAAGFGSSWNLLATKIAFELSYTRLR